jgi:hypothetical protein
VHLSRNKQQNASFLDMHIVLLMFAFVPHCLASAYKDNKNMIYNAYEYMILV